MRHRSPGSALHLTELSAEDREAALRSLARFRSPSDILIATKGNEKELVAASYAFEVLLEIAAPLPPRLEAQLAPWFIELRRRREQIRADIRRADSRHRRTVRQLPIHERG
jgi:hypothetical protein